MADTRHAENDDRLSMALERLVSIQKSMAELNQEAGQIRRHMKDFDFNVDALNLLATARSKDEESSGGKLLEDVINYARQSGTQMRVFGEEQVSPRVLNDPVPSNESLQAAERKIEVSALRGEKSQLLKVLGQLVVAAAVTTSLFVLIH